MYSIPVSAVKGRGTAKRLASRFDTNVRTAVDDGWSGGEADEAGAAPNRSRTEVIWEDARSVIVRNASPDIHFDTSINPYRGCEHGCVYCYARPTHSYLGMSPGLDFETRIVAKRNVAEILRTELAHARYRPSSLVVGTVTDAYQPVERELGLTRSVLELLAQTRHPFGVITKSSGVERDLDLIAPMAALGLATVHVTITTLDAKLARVMEPRAASPLRRLRTIRTLSEHGIPVGVSVAPQIPFVNEDMEKVLEAAREAGATRAFYTVLRLPWELDPIFREWLSVHFPQRANRVLARVRELHGRDEHGSGGDRLYDAQFGRRFTGQGTWAELLRQRFEKTCARLGFHRERAAPDMTLFRPPERSGQGALF